MTENKNSSPIDSPDMDEAPELDEHFFAHAQIRSGKTVLREATDTMRRRGRPPKGTSAKVQQSLRLSREVLEFFRSTGEGWQARIDEVLLRHVREQWASHHRVFEPILNLVTEDVGVLIGPPLGKAMLETHSVTGEVHARTERLNRIEGSGTFVDASEEKRTANRGRRGEKTHQGS